MVEILRINDYTTRNLLDFSYHQNYNKHIGTDLRQTNTTIPQKIIFKEKLEENDGATIFYIAEKPQEKTNCSKLFFTSIQRNRII